MYQWLQAAISGAVLALPHFLSPSTQPSSGLLSQATLDFTESLREKYNVPGISIGIIASPKHTGDGWKNETHGFGYMDVEGRAVDGDTLFAIASNSKLFTAISIGLLIDNQTTLENGKKLDYGTKVKDILPNWHMIDTYMENHLDLLDLLSMRTGMPAHDQAYAEEDASAIVARFAHLRPSTEIRQVMQYNNFHYWIVAEIVSHITQIPYPEFVKGHILDPVGMSDSTYNHLKAEETGHRAESFVRADQNYTRCAEVWAQEDKLDRSCYGQPFQAPWFTRGDGLFIAGCGGLVSSANDMNKWLKELLEPAVIPQNVIAETHKSFIPAFTNTVFFDEIGINNYGQAQMTFNYRGHEVIYHIGNVPGFGSQVMRLPALGIGIFLGINDNNIGHLIREVIVYRILDDLFGLDHMEWEEKLITADLRKGPSYAPVPTKPRAPPSADSLIGKYFDKGYGSLEILPFEDLAGQTIKSDTGAKDPEEFLRAVNRAMTTQPGVSAPLFFAYTNKLFGSIYVYSHFDGPTFNATMINVMENSKGELTAYIGYTNVAVFVEGEGLGMFHSFWGGGHGKTPVEKNVETEAEVWFKKEK